MQVGGRHSSGLADACGSSYVLLCISLRGRSSLPQRDSDVERGFVERGFRGNMVWAQRGRKLCWRISSSSRPTLWLLVSRGLQIVEMNGSGWSL